MWISLYMRKISFSFLSVYNEKSWDQRYDQNDGMGLLEYQNTRPCPPFVCQSRLHGPSTYKITPCWVTALSSSQPGGPPSWASPLVFGLNGYDSNQIEKKDKKATAAQGRTALQRRSHLCIPFLGIARPQSLFPHLCVCERFIYSQDRST
jgi:hypothetical protein